MIRVLPLAICAISFGISSGQCVPGGRLHHHKTIVNMIDHADIYEAFGPHMRTNTYAMAEQWTSHDCDRWWNAVDGDSKDGVGVPIFLYTSSK